jgi:arylsulfatase
MPHRGSPLLERRRLYTALIVSVAIAGCVRSAATGSSVPTGKPDIILITIDALRADHLGTYGYSRPTSPSIDAFAREAVVVQDAVSQAPYTKASMASLFTGLFPTAHKAFTTSRTFDNTMTGHVSGALPSTDVLSPRLKTLAECLTDAGYQTIGINTNPFLISDFGFGRGFAQYDFLTGRDVEVATASAVTSKALAHIDARDRQRPLFLWLHLMEPHSPYTPPDRFRQMFPPKGPPLTVPAEAIPAWIRVDNSTDANFYAALYDAEIRSADEALGTFFDGLKQRKLWDRSVVMLTADHGEEFYEHGGFEHNRTLYDEMLHVPLIVKAPGLAPRRLQEQLAEVDLLPTLVARAGGNVPAGLSGADVWSVLTGRRHAERYAYAELVGERYALRTREWKLISTLHGSHELYNLTSDPHERQSLVVEDTSRTAEMRDVLTKVLARAVQAGSHFQGAFAPIPPRVLERLKSLGYVQ